MLKDYGSTRAILCHLSVVLNPCPGDRSGAPQKIKFKVKSWLILQNKGAMKRGRGMCSMFKAFNLNVPALASFIDKVYLCFQRKPCCKRRTESFARNIGLLIMIICYLLRIQQYPLNTTYNILVKLWWA